MGDEGVSPSGPWNQAGGAGVTADGDQFFDPAFTMQKRLTFPGPYALDYCHNPYVGIVAKCPSDIAETAVPPKADAPPPETPPTAPGAPAKDDPSPSSAAGCHEARVGSPHDATSLVLVGLLLAATRRRRRR